MMAARKPAPVIAIDGPSASGKGTVAQAVAGALGFHYLDSGALYRLVALAAMRHGIPMADEKALAKIASGLDVRFVENNIILENHVITEELRSEACANQASVVAAVPAVRAALLERQRAFRRKPGLVADGRDMGSVIFPDARLKIFLTATAEVRAERRHKQLKQKGFIATLNALLQDIRDRDARDASRCAAPLRQSPDARVLDTTTLSIADAVGRVLGWYRETESQQKQQHKQE